MKFDPNTLSLSQVSNVFLRQQRKGTLQFSSPSECLQHSLPLLGGALPSSIIGTADAAGDCPSLDTICQQDTIVARDGVPTSDRQLKQQRPLFLDINAATAPTPLSAGLFFDGLPFAVLILTAVTLPSRNSINISQLVTKNSSGVETTHVAGSSTPNVRCSVRNRQYAAKTSE